MNRILLITGDKIGILSIALIKYDSEFNNNFDTFAEKTCKEALQWACKPSLRMPVNAVASEKARVTLDFPTFMKSFYFWKTLTKKDNLPLPPMIRISPMRHSFWNKTKHGLDVKT